MVSLCASADAGDSISIAKNLLMEQKAVKTTAFDLQLNLSSPGLRFHRLERPRDPNFWSVRVNEDVRLIVHRTPASLLLCYVGHQDTAYAWAERRRIERHPTTGAAQLVELPERVDPRVNSVGDEGERLRPSAASALAKPLLFAGIADDALLGYGVPAERLDEVRGADQDTLFDIAERLPQEAAEALLNLASGTTPAMPERAPIEADPFAHPDAQRRFRVLTNIEELEQALDYPWDKWAAFLHPAQRRLVDRDYSGPARVSGSAGTGKTIVALHRAVALARRYPQARVLLTTFSKALGNALRIRLRTLTADEPDIADRIAVHPVTGIGYDLYTAAFGQPNIAPPALIETLLRQAAAEVEGSPLGLEKAFSRTRSAYSSARITSFAARGTRSRKLTDRIEVMPGRVAIGTMHLAKGLEFRAVAVMACDDVVEPGQARPKRNQG